MPLDEPIISKLSLVEEIGVIIEMKWRGNGRITRLGYDDLNKRVF